LLEVPLELVINNYGGEYLLALNGIPDDVLIEYASVASADLEYMQFAVL
jgi:hypothetical protein